MRFNAENPIPHTSVVSVRRDQTTHLPPVLDAWLQKYHQSPVEMHKAWALARRFDPANKENSSSISLSTVKHIVRVIMDISEEEKIACILNAALFERAKTSKNPILIHRGGIAIYWNPEYEKITGYTLKDAEQISSERGITVMELLYGYDPEELERVKAHVARLDKTGIGYQRLIFTLQSRTEELIELAWHNEKFSNDITIREGSRNICEEMEKTSQTHAILKSGTLERMKFKDAYTSGHINRVMELSTLIAQSFEYPQTEADYVEIMAILHDMGKLVIPDDILKKPGNLTKEEIDEMNSHSGYGIINGIAQ